ncbi:MAG: TolC family outer membrane protein [Rhodobacteraceae bacterium]|nr:TolC family outer membrane protein [Paracoccaceae bacterium]
MIVAKVRYLAAVAGFTVAMVAATLPARAETLADALTSAYKTSHLIDQNRAVLRAADEDVASAVARLRPVLQWVAQSSIYDIPSGSGLSASLALQGQVTILDFGRGKIGIDIAKESVMATREALIGIEQQVLFSAVRAYFSVSSATENVALNRNSVRVLDETLRATKDQFDVGEVTRTDVAQAEARVASARAGLASAEGQLAAAREEYRAATGHYPGVLAPAPRAPALPGSMAEATAIANRSHPAIRQAQHQALAADFGIALAAAQRMPELNGNLQLKSDSQTGGSSAIGFELSQTIFSGGAMSAAHRKAIAQRDAARSALHQATVIVTQGVGTSWSEIEVARAQISATDRQIEAARIAYDGVREEAKLGARTTLDVLNAEQDLLNAQADRISTDAGLQVAFYSLLASMGLLTVEHLNLGLPVYDPSAYYNAVENAPVTSVQGKSLDRVLKAIGRN